MPPVKTIRPDPARITERPSGRLELRRRDALKLLAGGVALPLAGCSRPNEEIIPYVDMPERLVAGEPSYYATALPLAGYLRGVLVKAIDGRPLKVEGNPRHPASLGSTDIFAQAEILSLYDPDRSGTVRGREPVATWVAFLSALRPRMESLKKSGGAGLRIVTGRVTSPTLLRQIEALRRTFPNARWHAYEPAEGDLSGAAPAVPRPRLSDADVIVSLDADFLGAGPDQVANARAFAARRDPNSGKGISRLYVVETARTLTGANADHRLSLDPAALETFTRALLSRMKGEGVQAAGLPDAAARLVEAVAADMTRPGSRGVIVAGDTLSTETRSLALETMPLSPDTSQADANSAQPAGPAPLEDLWKSLEAGEVTDLLTLDRNPFHDFPDEKLRAAIGKVPFSVHAGLYEDETAEASRWHLPLSHPLESWSDGASTDGTLSIVQPLIRPLYDTRSIHEIMALYLGEPAASGYEIVRRTWREGRDGDAFETWWRQALHDGVLSSERGSVAATTGVRSTGHPGEAAAGGFAAVIRPDPSVYDGAYSNNAWLQECPKPIGKHTWSNVVSLSPGDAGRLSVGDGDVVAVKSAEGRIEGPVHVDAGQAHGVVGLTLGYGRTRGGAIGTGLGYNARELSPRAIASLVAPVEVTATDKHDPVPSTQQHFTLEGDFAKLMPVVTQATDFTIDRSERPGSGKHFNHPNPESDGYSWAMVIDSAACIGCNACVVACQVENNIPVVGPEEVARHRIMHWLRIDRYEREESEHSVAGFEPVPCMQCEKAPCEPVCPVEASVHDIEGINNQVYNRCVGTRFCQSNCPYKVRRFNWFAYGSGQEYKNLGEDPMPAEKNPDVTVRARGVMEKCTYCVQRVSRARRDAEKSDRPIADGEVVTACQQACPTQAIRFGNLEDDGSQVTRLRDDPRHFTLLEELGTSPRTTYLARLRNANPDLDGDA